MALIGDKDLEERMHNAKKKLDRPFQRAKDLLRTLEELETYLGKIDQSESDVMETALSPAFGSLVKPQLLRHHDEVVRLVALSCISEIMRILAGLNSYNDQIMREILHAMVKSFKKLDNIRDPYFTKRARLLEVFARCRFENIMLTVGCIGDIRRMFNTFWNVIGRNLYEEFNRHADSIQGDISTSLGNDLSASSSQAEVVKDVMQVESVISEGDITGTSDCVVDTDSDCSTVSPDEVTAVEDIVMFEDSTIDQKLSIQDFAEKEYQGQLDASSHEIEASNSSLSLASQLKMREKDIVATLSHHDRMRDMIEDHI